MRLSLNIIFSFIAFLILAISAFAHETEVVHEEPIPTISPFLLVGLVAALAIGGFLIWRFMLRNPNPPLSSSTQPQSNPQTQEENISKGVESELSSQSK